MRSILVTPLSPRLRGNGLAQRCAMWHEALVGLGEVTSVVAPVAGPAAPGSQEVVVVASNEVAPPLPRLARGLTVERGWAVADQLGARGGGVDLVIAVRSYVGLLGIGLRDATGARLVVDLDDDDVSFCRSVGEEAEAARFERLVECVVAGADLVVSAQGFADTRAVPNSTRVPMPQAEPGARPTARRVVMVGNMGYRPNAEGARWLVESVMPLVWERMPGAELVVAGPGSESIPSFGRGYVADLSAVLAGAGVAVAPLLHGSGTRIKILDAWAHGRAVVATTVGADGLGAMPGVHLLVADDEASFATAVVRVLEDPDLADALGSAGRELVMERYSRERVVSEVQDLLGATLASTRMTDVGPVAPLGGLR